MKRPEAYAVVLVAERDARHTDRSSLDERREPPVGQRVDEDVGRFEDGTERGCRSDGPKAPSRTALRFGPGARGGRTDDEDASVRVTIEHREVCIDERHARSESELIPRSHGEQEDFAFAYPKGSLRLRLRHASFRDRNWKRQYGATRPLETSPCDRDFDPIIRRVDEDVTDRGPQPKDVVRVVDEDHGHRPAPPKSDSRHDIVRVCVEDDVVRARECSP